QPRGMAPVWGARTGAGAVTGVRQPRGMAPVWGARTWAGAVTGVRQPRGMAPGLTYPELVGDPVWMPLKLPCEVSPRRSDVVPAQRPGIITATPLETLRVLARRVNAPCRLGLGIAHKSGQRHMRCITDDDVHMVAQHRLCVHPDARAARR